MTHSITDFLSRHRAKRRPSELRDDPQLRLGAKSEGLGSGPVLLMVSQNCIQNAHPAYSICTGSPLVPSILVAARAAAGTDPAAGYGGRDDPG